MAVIKVRINEVTECSPAVWQNVFETNFTAGILNDHLLCPGRAIIRMKIIVVEPVFIGVVQL